jgi:MFS family permease
VALLPVGKPPDRRARLDVAGAITVTSSLLLAVYAIVHGNEAGWTSAQTLAQLVTAIALLIAFLVIESRVSHPLMPLRMFALRNVATANVVGVLWAASLFAWFFISALYMQRVLNYNAMQVGLAFLPANIIMAAFSIGLSAKLVMRCGIRPPLTVGLLMAAAGLALFSRAPTSGNFVRDLLLPMVLMGLGAGVAFNPVLMAAMSDVAPDESGLASGLVNTSFMMGGALGLAILASLAAARTDRLAATGTDAATALNSGYHLVFLIGAIAAAIASALAAAFVRTRSGTDTDVAAACNATELPGAARTEAAGGSKRILEELHIADPAVRHSDE